MCLSYTQASSNSNTILSFLAGYDYSMFSVEIEVSYCSQWIVSLCMYFCVHTLCVCVCVCVFVNVVCV